MKTTISITGQISSISTLRNNIITASCEEKRGMFNAVILTFNTRKQAYKAISEARMAFRRQGYDFKGTSGVRYRAKDFIAYDAATAVITK